MSDLSKGRWRKLYAQGVIEGKRINNISLPAEAWLWRLMLLADDYGNLPADPDIQRGRASPRRKMTTAQVRKLNKELADAGLAVPYTAEGEDYYHLDGFENLQRPANGKWVRRYPLCPTQRNPENPEKPKRSGSPNPEGPKPEPETQPEPKPTESRREDSAAPSGGGGSGGCGTAVEAARLLVAVGFEPADAAMQASRYKPSRIAECVAVCRQKPRRTPTGFVMSWLAKSKPEHMTDGWRAQQRVNAIKGGQSRSPPDGKALSCG